MPDLLIVHCNQLLTVCGASRTPKSSHDMDDLGIITDGAVAIKNKKIIDVGTTGRLKRYYRKGAKVIDASGKIALPGFVDSHTHAVFAGSREQEFVQRLRGETYLNILKKGGGILSTVKKTRSLSMRELIESTTKHLDIMLSHGTTTAEVKSGYGLNLKSELRILKTLQHLKKSHPMDIVPTFLGAHVVPPEYKTNPATYVDLLCTMLPKVKPYATFCDVFCDEGAFDVKQSENILKTAKDIGFKLKIHANEFKDIGGVSMAVKLRVMSVDHLDTIQPNDLQKLKKSKTLCVLLPGVSFFLMKEHFSPARMMLEKGLAIALATDFNPGTSPSGNMQMMITLACLKMGMTPAQAINAATINGAHALGMAHQTGSIETGKQADIIILDIQDYNQIPYYFGINHVNVVIKNGRVVVNNKQPNYLT